MAETESVDAAVAYVSDERTLIDACIRNSVRLKLWARYDFSMPVSDVVIERFLSKRSPDFTLRIVPDIFHPKVIWWHGFGAYVGSANLTQRAWSGGMRSQTFMTEEELTEQGLEDEFTSFFGGSIILTPDNDEFLNHTALSNSPKMVGIVKRNARKLFEESRASLEFRRSLRCLTLHASQGGTSGDRLS